MSNLLSNRCVFISSGRRRWLTLKIQLTRLWSFKSILFVLFADCMIVSNTLEARDLGKFELRDHPVFFIVALSVVLFIFYILAKWANEIENHCSACDKLGALTGAGATEIRRENESWKQFKCKYCGEIVWKKEVQESDDGGD